MTPPPAPASSPTSASAATSTTGRLGDRQLEVVQVIDVGRLQSEPIVLRPGALVAVTGMGPRDSNETSKTTWLAATTLLTGDHGWRLSRGQSGSYAARLLFNPPDDPGAATRADTGWVVGVFGRGGRDRLTVLLRIQRDSPYLRFRIAPGTHLVGGDGHTARIRAAAEVWDRVPAEGTYGPEQYLDTVLGGTPRSTGYVSDRGGLPQRRVGLLTTDLHHLTPREIGEELIELAGLRDRLVRERDQRRTVAELRDEVERQRRALREAEAQAEAELAALAQRRRAQEQALVAVSLRDAQVAAQVLERLDRRRELSGRWHRASTSPAAQRLRDELADVELQVDELADAASLEQAVTAARDDLARVEPPHDRASERVRAAEIEAGVIERRLGDADLAVADRASGRPVPDVASERAALRDRVRSTGAAVEVARESLARTETHLADLAAGRPTEAAAALAAAGVVATVVGDAIELTDDGRELWDPVLARWSDALAVRAADIDWALEACAALPGTVLVPYDERSAGSESGADGELPVGVRSAPASLHRFLHEVAVAVPGATTGTRHVRVDAPTHVLVGGYEHPQIGAQARLAQARRARDAAAASFTAAEHAAAEASTLLTELDDELAAAEAHATRETLRRRRGEVGRELAEARAELVAAAEVLDVARDAVTRAQQMLVQRRERLQRSRELLEARRELVAQKVDLPLRQLEAELDRLGLPWWTSRLTEIASGPVVAPLPAVQVAASEPDDLPVRELAAGVLADRLAGDARSATAVNLDRRTNEALERARDALGIRVRTAADGSLEVDAPTNVLREVREAARERAEAVAGAGTEEMLRTFDRFSAALLAWLEPQLERDVVREEQLERLLSDRRRSVAAAEDAHERQANAAQALQSSIHDIVQSTLQQVGTAFAGEVAEDGLLGELRIEPVLPAMDDVIAELRWDVTPRWARRTGAEPVDYRRPANFAQMKVRAIQLVLAALRADGPGGRILVLDELGAGLGADNRERVLAALRDVAARSDVTVLATVQDDLLTAAAPHVGEVLFFRYRDTSDDLNQPTRMLVQGPDGRLVELQDALEAGRAFGFDDTSPVMPDQLAFGGEVEAIAPDVEGQVVDGVVVEEPSG